MRRATRLALLCPVLAIVMLASLGVVPVANAANGEPLKWGAYPARRSGETKQQAVERLEALAGRKLDVVRAFYRWDEAWPTSYETWLKSSGHPMIMSVKARRLNGVAVKWADIANAQPGSVLYQDLVRWAQRVRDYGAPIHVTFNHEPETKTNLDLGEAPDFIAAWRKWVSIFRQEGASNASFLWIMTDYAFWQPATDRRQAVKWYPGDGWVDGMAADAYNWFNCRPGINTRWLTLREIIEPLRQFWLQHQSEQVWVAEYGSAEDSANPTRKAQWYAEAQALFKTPEFAVFRGVSLYERGSSTDNTCYWQPDSSPAAAAAWREWGQDPYYGGPGSEPPPPPPPTARTALLVVNDPANLGSDALLISRLQGLGFTVTVADDDTAAATHATGKSVVLISQSISSTAAATRLRDITRPVLVWKPSAYDELRMTPVATTVATGKQSITIIRPAHPLAAGRSGTVRLATVTTPLGFGTVASGATVVATVGDGLSSLFVYLTGAQMFGGTAPACRIAFPLHKDAVPALTVDGWALFDRAATWAADGCPTG